mmetsp:Transcript_130440/g.316862  ORF Transcript_130440/g.316862 Transcript_130440/m.316862 type:complete len:286 (-) Transcript_130440:75-932(-)
MTKITTQTMMASTPMRAPSRSRFTCRGVALAEVSGRQPQVFLPLPPSLPAMSWAILPMRVRMPVSTTMPLPLPLVTLQPLKTMFSGVSFSVDQSSRIAILGRNGAGKSTIIKLLLGKLKARAGLCQRHRGARIQYIAQHHLDELDGDSSPLKLALERFPGDGSNSHELKMRQHLGHFGLSGDVLPFQLIRTLSGGQKFRVSLALAMWEKPHLLIMDEPTNHLDMETIDALIKAINEFKGGVMVVSHDEHLIASCCKELRVVANKRVVQYNGTIETYKKQILTGKA